MEEKFQRHIPAVKNKREMNEDLLSDLKKKFSETNDREWSAAASQEIDGKDPFSALTWYGKNEISLRPYYSSDSVKSTLAEDFKLKPSQHNYLGNRVWLNAPIIIVDDERASNSLALEHLAMGADGIVLDVRSRTHVDLHTLLHAIQLPFCSVSFIVSHEQVAHAIEEYLRQQTTAPFDVNIFWESVPIIELTTNDASPSSTRRLGVIINRASAVMEIAEALLRGVSIVRNITHPKESHVFRHIAFSISVSGDLLENMAKLRALRRLWYQVARSYGLDDYQQEQLFIHAVSDVFEEEKYEPHGNMIKGTIAALSAIGGGCDLLSVLPQDHHNKTQQRIARNVSNILRAESFFDKHADPIAGAYAVEVMTDKFAQEAWGVFQNKIVE